MKVFTVINSGGDYSDRYYDYCGTFSSREKAEEFILIKSSPPSIEKIQKEFDETVEKYFKNIREVQIPSAQATIVSLEKRKEKGNFNKFYAERLAYTEKQLSALQIRLENREHTFTFEQYFKSQNSLHSMYNALENFSIIESVLDRPEDAT